MYCTYVTGTCDYLIIIIFWIQSSAEKNIFAYDSILVQYDYTAFDFFYTTLVQKNKDPIGLLLDIYLSILWYHDVLLFLSLLLYHTILISTHNLFMNGHA